MTTVTLISSDTDLETDSLIWLDASANRSEENIATQKEFRSIILEIANSTNHYRISPKRQIIPLEKMFLAHIRLILIIIKKPKVNVM